METVSPLLFDKLSSNPPKNRLSAWQAILARDIENLLNEASHSARLNLKNHQYAEDSVLNLGYSLFSEYLPIGTDPIVLAQKINNILSVFEPRLDSNSIRVVPILDVDDQQVLSILFDIHAITYMNNKDFIFNLKISLDYSCGIIKAI